jgi:hypothetical protein
LTYIIENRYFDDVFSDWVVCLWNIQRIFVLGWRSEGFFLKESREINVNYLVFWGFVK